MEDSDRDGGAGKKKERKKISLRQERLVGEIFFSGGRARPA